MVDYALEHAPELGFVKEGNGKLYYAENGEGVYDINLPDTIRDWFGLDDCDPRLKTAEQEVSLGNDVVHLPRVLTAITANDSYRLSFAVIADLFEATYLGEL
jgi:hypothetical protein